MTSIARGVHPRRVKGRPYRLLVLEDEVADLLLTSTALQEVGPAPPVLLQAKSVEEARQTLRIGGIDLILADLKVPDSRGPETIRRLQSFAFGIPIIALTSGSSPSDGLACIVAGAEDFVPKGEIHRRLAEAVEFTLRREHRGQRESVEQLDALRKSLASPGEVEVPDSQSADFARLFEEFRGGNDDYAKGLRELAVRMAQSEVAPARVLHELTQMRLSRAWDATHRQQSLSGTLLLRFAIETMTDLAQAYYERDADDRDNH